MALKDFFSFKISREFIVLMFFMVAVFFFFIYETEQMGVKQLYVEINEIQTKIRVARIENEKVAMEIDDLKTDIGVVRLARERLRLVFPGEIVVKAVSSEEVQIQMLRNRNALAKKSEVKSIKREEITLSSGGDDSNVEGGPPEEVEPDDIIDEEPEDVESGQN